MVSFDLETMVLQKMRKIGTMKAGWFWDGLQKWESGAEAFEVLGNKRIQLLIVNLGRQLSPHHAPHP